MVQRIMDILLPLKTIPLPSKFHSERKRSPELIVIHWLSDVALLNQYKVSAHYFIDQKGKVFAMVDESRKAWHAGVSYHPLFGKSLNDVSIGIELEGPPSLKGWDSWSEVQIKTCAKLCREIALRHNIIGVTDHHTIAPKRKIDVLAGTGVDLFPWDYLLSNTGLSDLSLSNLHT